MNSTWYRFALHTVKLPGLFYLKCTWSTRLKYLNYGPVKCIPRSKCSTTAVHWQCQCSEVLHFTARPMKCICCKYIRKTLVITLLWRFLHSWPWHIKLVKTPPPQTSKVFGIPAQGSGSTKKWSSKLAQWFFFQTHIVWILQFKDTPFHTLLHNFYGL